jgi:TorA maturation chaperone TorD
METMSAPPTDLMANAARPRLYLLCASLFAEPDARRLRGTLRPLAQALADNWYEAAPWRAQVTAVRDALPTGGAVLERLRLEFSRLFVLAAGFVPVQPYGSYWLDGKATLYGPSLRMVEELMRAEGVWPAAGSGLAPDHAVCELELMAHIASQEGPGQRRQQSNFLLNHLARWIPPFARAVRENTRNRYYRASADLVESVVMWDAVRLANRPPTRDSHADIEVNYE